jgi:hypothetical protein
MRSSSNYEIILVRSTRVDADEWDACGKAGDRGSRWDGLRVPRTGNAAGGARYVPIQERWKESSRIQHLPSQARFHNRSGDCAGKANKPQMPMIEGAIGVLFADPGSRALSGLSTNLLPGRTYGVLCIFRDSTGAPSHYSMGMYSVIRVTGPAVRAAIAADSVVAVDYAFAKYPREISPGRHTIAFRNSGKHRHEIHVALLKKGVTLDSVVAVDKRDGDVDPLFDTNGGMGVLHAQPGQTALGGLSIDFLPGREYLIDCGFSDDDKSPPHYKLGMYGSIRVRGR